MKTTNRIIYLLLVGILLAFSGCGPIDDRMNESSEEKTTRQMDQMMSMKDQVVGMPNITNWQEAKLVAMLYELRDQEDFQTYTYIIDMNGNKHFLGRSLGYGIPASVQFSNPDRLVDVEDFGIDSYQSNDAAVIAQPEPNGLYMPEGLAATYVFLYDEGTEEFRPVYVEPEIMVSPFPLH